MRQADDPSFISQCLQSGEKKWLLMIKLWERQSDHDRMSPKYSVWRGPKLLRFAPMGSYAPHSHSEPRHRLGPIFGPIFGPPLCGGIICVY